MVFEFAIFLHMFLVDVTFVYINCVFSYLRYII